MKPERTAKRERMAWLVGLVASGMTLVSGCDDAATPPATAPAAGQSAPGTSAAPGPGTAAPNTAAAPAAAPAVPAAAPTSTAKAEVGVGKKGTGYGGGIVTEPIRQYFRAQESIAFNIQIPEGMKIFRAEHNRNPKDMAEFKRDILEPAGIQLPELPFGETYVYDAKEGELMVQRPVPGGQ